MSKLNHCTNKIFSTDKHIRKGGITYWRSWVHAKVMELTSWLNICCWQGPGHIKWITVWVWRALIDCSNFFNQSERLKPAYQGAGIGLVRMGWRNGNGMRAIKGEFSSSFCQFLFISLSLSFFLSSTLSSSLCVHSCKEKTEDPFRLRCDSAVTCYRWLRCQIIGYFANFLCQRVAHCFFPADCEEGFTAS